MTVLLITLAVLLWWSSAYRLYVWTWTRTNDFDTNDRVFFAFMALAGPLPGLLVAALDVLDAREARVLIRRRGR